MRENVVMSSRLNAMDADLIAYYHLDSCAWVRDERRDCSCGLLDRVAAIAARSNPS